MLIYNKQWLDNLAIRRTTKHWFKKGMVTEEEQKAIAAKYQTPYKHSNIFARIGYFIFTLIIQASAYGLFILFFAAEVNTTSISVACILFGACNYAFAEYFVSSEKNIKSGIIDALLYTGLVFICAGIILPLPYDLKDNQPVITFLIIFPFVTFVAVRFADAFLALISFACLLIINGLLVLKLGTTGKIILPFESMGLSYLVYYLVVKQKKKDAMRYWNNCLTILEIAGLTALYLSGNYMTIRKLTESLLNTTIGPGQDIMLAPVFYAYTILVPLIYVWLGLKRKNYTFLRLGLLLLVGGILSIKYYHSFMPAEYAMTLGGAVMILVAYFSIRYLKTPQHGITFEIEEQNAKHKAITNIANIAISQVMASQPHPTKPDGPEFGGGDFGGGGAGADF